jgi:putative sugar O-methyltransferase
MNLEKQTSKLVKELRTAALQDPDGKWRHGPVESWKKELELYSDDKHIKNFRRSFIVAGVLNPPDRPFKINKKYDGLQEDCIEWFKGISIIDKLRGGRLVFKLFNALKKRLNNLDIKYSYAELADDTVGNPVKFLIPFIGGVTEASIRYWYYSSFLKKYIGSANTVVEIGSGYGGLSKRVREKLDVKKYVLVDLPENLSLAYYYNSSLKNTDVHTILNTSDLSKLDEDGVFLVGPWMLKELSVDVDLVINTMSFQHMTVDNLEYYFDFINKVMPNAVYHVNRNVKRDETDIVVDDYPRLTGMSLEYDKEWIFPVHNEIIWTRNTN